MGILKLKLLDIAEPLVAVVVVGFAKLKLVGGVDSFAVDFAKLKLVIGVVSLVAVVVIDFAKLKLVDRVESLAAAAIVVVVVVVIVVGSFVTLGNGKDELIGVVDGRN